MVFGASIILRRGASLPSQPFPGPFSNGPYVVAAPPCAEAKGAGHRPAPTISRPPLGSCFRGNDGEGCVLGLFVRR